MERQPYNLRPLWDAILDVYQAFADVCNRHGLRYYVTGGTLLGAARHKGFIPWDDDFDVVMPRRDYRKFFDLYANELPARFRAFDFKTKQPEDDWSWMFGKVMLEDSERVGEIIEKSRLNLKQGIFIDVIPIDGLPKETIPFYIWLGLRSCWRRFVPKFLRRHYFEAWLMRWDYDKSPAVDDYNTNSRRLKTRALNSESFGDPVMLPFDKLEVPCPSEWKKFLTLIYGDWRKLPPESARHPTHQIRA